MQVVKTTGDRALDEEINRILARVKAAEEALAEMQKTISELPGTNSGPRGPVGPQGPISGSSIILGGF